MSNDYQEEYYVKLNREKCRWELWFWLGTERLVFSQSYDDTAYNFKEAKILVYKIKESIENEPYRKEWEYENHEGGKKE